MKHNPVPYKSINRGQVFTLHGSRELLIKHSDAVSFNSEGTDVIPSIYDPCYPKSVDKETYNLLMRFVIRQDLSV